MFFGHIVKKHILFRNFLNYRLSFWWLFQFTLVPLTIRITKSLIFDNLNKFHLFKSLSRNVVKT